jgi:hypothetical protein
LTFGYAWSTATEANTQWTIQVAGDFTSFGARVAGNTCSTTTTLRFRINGANANNVISVSGSSNGWFEDVTPNTDTVAPGDLIGMTITRGTGAGNFFLGNPNISFEAASGSVSFLGWSSDLVSGLNHSAASTTTEQTCFGGDSEATNANARVDLEAAGTASDFELRVLSNARSTTTTGNFYINGSAVNQTVSVTASSTGLFQDTTNTDAIVATNDVSFGLVTGTGTGNFFIQWYRAHMTNTTSAFDIGWARMTGSTLLYQPIMGNDATNTLSDAESAVPFACTALNLRVRLTGAGHSAYTLSLSINGSAGSQAVSVTAATTGVFSDLVNTDPLNDGDDLAYVKSTATITQQRWIAMTVDPGSGITPGNGPEVHHYNTVILG